MQCNVSKLGRLTGGRLRTPFVKLNGNPEKDSEQKVVLLIALTLRH